MPTSSIDPDDLLDRLRTRAADADRRTDHRPSAFDAHVTSLDLGSLFGELQGVKGLLDRHLASLQTGTIDPEVTAAAEGIGRSLATPAARPLAASSSVAALDGAETTLGFALPSFLRRVYAEVADGGFGPGTGLLPVSQVVRTYRSMLEHDLVPRTQRWPERLLPIVDSDPVLDCVDASSEHGRIVTWDPEDLEERSGTAAWARSFEDTAPSLEAWLDGWVNGPTAEERTHVMSDDSLPAAEIQQARESRAMLAAMTPEERAAMGLPAEGWERVVWGGLGLDED